MILSPPPPAPAPASPPATATVADGRRATRWFDIRQHRRVAGLFDICLEPHRGGGMAAPADPAVAVSAAQLADLVRRSADPADDVRILTEDGQAHRPLFGELAGLLGRDVLITPAGADVRHRQHGDEADGLFDAVPVDRATRQPVNWVVVQPPDLATPLPGWFAVDGGVVRPRGGVVGLPLPDGLALATRADFVTRRAAAHRLRTGYPGLATLAVTVRGGAFLTGDYHGTQEVHSGQRLAALLAELPLYGCDLRLWLTWPADPAEQRRLAGNVAELADTVGATVWTPPPGGAAELLDDGGDLRATDRAGAPADWRASHPARFTGDPPFQSGPDGRLLPAGAAAPITIHIAHPPAVAQPALMPYPQPVPHPPVHAEPRRSAPLGVCWLPPGQPVNSDVFELFVASHRSPGQVARDGVPGPELFLIGRLDPRPAQEAQAGTYLLRIRVEPGGAVPVTSMHARVPANLQHRLGDHGEYLLPAGRLDRLRLLAGYRPGAAGRLSAEGEFGDVPVRIDCAGAWHGVSGLPNDVLRWPAVRSGTAYALVPRHGCSLPRGWLPLHRRRPEPVEGRLLLELNVPAGRVIDVPATADALAKLPAVRSRAERLRSAGITLIAPGRAYHRLTVHRMFDPAQSSWQRRRDRVDGPLTTVLPVSPG